jgi:site-specific recombinase XerD
MMLADYLRWLEHNKGNAVSTVNSYEGYLKRLGVHCADRGTTLEQADRRILEEFTGVVAHQAGITLNSRKPLIAAVRGLYKWAHEAERIPTNPAKSIAYPRLGRPLPTPISRSHAEKVLLACDLNTFTGRRDAALLAMLIGSGMRVSGLSSLTSQSLSFEPMEEGGAFELFVRVTEKGRKERIIPMPRVMSAYMIQYLTDPEMVALLPVLSLPNGDHILWVQTNRGSVPEHDWYGEKRRLSVGGIRDIIKRRGKAAGVPDDQLHPHAFRHLYGTELAEHDTDPQRIQILMGHSSAESTNIYKHLATRKLVQVVNQANPLLNMQTPIHAMYNNISGVKSLPGKR